MALGATDRLRRRVEGHVKVLYRAAPGVLTVALTAAVAACGTQAAAQPGDQPGGQTGAQTARPPTVAAGTPVPVGIGTASTARATPIAGPASQPPTSPPILTGPAALTAADNGALVRLRIGQHVSVTLASRGMFSWYVPAAAGTAVRRVTASGGYPAQQPARAVFLAVRPGSATLSTIDDTACLHDQPACLPAQQEWRVTVVVARG